jgi:hypothetical protein
MFPLLLSVLSGVRELSATASLAELLRQEVPPDFPTMPGVSQKDLIASLCPIAAAFIVAMIRSYNEKQIQERTSSPRVRPASLLTFGDVNVGSHNNCGDIVTTLEPRRSERFYVSDDSIMNFRVRRSSFKLGGVDVLM